MTNSGVVYIEGFLIKQGHIMRNWKTRWFKLSDSSLRYYIDKKHNVPLGRIPLKNAGLVKDIGNLKERENVFIITTSSDIRYPIQAPSASDFNLWFRAIQRVIDSFNAQVEEGFGQTQIIGKSGSVASTKDEQEKAELIVKLGKTQDSAKAYSAKINGTLYDQVLSGVELLRWVNNHLDISVHEAEDTARTLLKTGFIDCLTSDTFDDTLFHGHQFFRLLSDEAAIENIMSTTYLDNLGNNVPTDSTSNSHCSKLKKSSPFHQIEPGLPTDLPPGDLIKRGILFKRGHIIPSWKARCFVLQKFPATLSYFDPTKKHLKTINSLCLCGASVFSVSKETANSALKVSNPPEHLFCVKLANGSIYLINGASQIEQEEWINAIQPLCRRKGKQN